MRNALLAVALALGIGFAATGAQAAMPGGDLSALKSVAATNGNSVVEKTYYRRYWRHNYYYRHHHRHYGWRYHHRHYGWRYHHRHYGWRHHHRHHWGLYHRWR
jgi:hypothetical protein